MMKREAKLRGCESEKKKRKEQEKSVLKLEIVNGVKLGLIAEM